MTKKLTDALEDQKQHTEQFNQKISGILGIPLGGQRRVEVSGRNAYVYVRLRSNQSEVIQAYNNTVATSYNLPVLVERQGNRYVVISVDTQRYDNNWNSNSSFVPRHGNAHSFDIESGGGGDIVWVYPRQIVPILVMPSGSVGAEGVIVNPYTLRDNNNVWKYVGNTGTASLAPYRPTSPTGAVMALVYLDVNSGNPYLLINSGTVFSNTITGSSQVYQYIPQITNPATQIPLAAIRLITGTSRISWDNMYDVRQFLHAMTTGSGAGALTFLDLTDTPNSYSGKSGTVVRVKYDESGVEFPDALDEIVFANRDDVAPPASRSKLFVNNGDILIHRDSYFDSHRISYATLDNAYQEKRLFDSSTGTTALTDADYPIQTLMAGSFADIWIRLPDGSLGNHPFVFHNNTTGSVAHIYDGLGNSDTLVPGQSGWFLSRANEDDSYRYVTMLKNTPT